MRAAALLRLRELRRRGGLALLVAAFAGVFAVGLSSYGLASDLAATLGYVAALLCGAFPLAIDRERRRSHLTGASPVAPWAWALGSGAGAGAGAAVATLLLFAAAGLGGAAGGGIETRVAHPVDARGTVWIAPALPITGLPEDAEAVRTELRAYFREPDARGVPAEVTLAVDGREETVPTGQAIKLAARAPTVEVRNLEAGIAVGIVADRTRILGAERSFLWNAVLAGLAPALAAIGLAALGAAAGANLSAPVAALLAATLLLVASLKGFLLETWEHEGKVAAAVAGEERHDDEGHHHEPVRPAPLAVQALMRGLLFLLPDLPSLDASDRVSRGEWAGAGPARLLAAAKLAAAGLLCAAVLGGLGVFLRRMP